MSESRSVRPDDLFLATRLVNQGVTSREKVDECLAELLARIEEGGSSARLGDLLAERGYATVQQIQATLKAAPSGVELAPGHASAYRPDSAFSSRYAIGGEIARGGMGIILDGKDLEIRRELAIKVLIEENAGPEQVARFVEEAQVQGQLEHPNICPVHELGKDAEGRLYFTMKKVKGLSLAQILQALRRSDDPERARRHSLAWRLDVFTKVCDAVAFAHSRGVIHRDLKPENIMIGEFGEVLVMDWGLAKIVGREDRNRERLVVSTRAEQGALLSMDGSILGTPAYMPPEQARGRLDEIDERSDVYALGGILYAILTLRPPIEGADPLEILRQAQEGRIVPPSRRAPDRNVPPDLEAAAMKALSAERADRYPTVKAVRDEITAFLEGRTLAAAQYTFRQLVAKWYGRNRVFALTASTAALLLLAGAVLYVIDVTRARADARSKEALAVAEADRARRAEADVRRKKEEAELRLAESLVAQGDALALAGRGAAARARYDEARETFGKLGLPTVAADTGLLRLFRSAPNPLLSLSPGQGAVYAVALSPDARWLAAGENAPKKNLTVWEAATGLLGRVLPGHEGGTLAAAFSPDGRWLLSGGKDRALRLWDLATGALAGTMSGHRDQVWGIVFSPDGARAASTSKDGTLRVWEIPAGREALTLSGHGANLSRPAFSADGRFLVAPHGPNEIKVWELPGGREVRTLTGSSGYVLAVAVSPDRSLVASGGHDNRVRLWEFESGRAVAELGGHAGFVGSVSFAPDGRTLLSGAWDHALKLWDVATRREIAAFSHHEASVLEAGFSRDGRFFVSGGADGQVKIWDGRWRGVPPELGAGPVSAFAVSPDGRLILAATPRGPEVWDAETGRVLAAWGPLPGGVSSLAFDPPGRRALCGTGDGTIRLWDLEASRELPSWKAHETAVTALVFSPEGRLASGAKDGTVALWDPADGTKKLYFRAHWDRVSGMAFLADGTLATGGLDSNLNLWEAGTGRNLRSLTLEGAITTVNAVRERGRILVTNWGQDLHFIDLETGRHVSCVRGHTSGVTTVALSGDARWALSGSWDKTVRLSDLESGREVRVLTEGETPSGLGLSSDATRAFLLVDGRLELLRLDFFAWRDGLNARFKAARGAPEARRPAEVAGVLGESYAIREIHDRAIELFERARLGGVDVPALPLARAYWGVGRADDARKEFERALARREGPESYLKLCLRALARK